MNAPVNIRRLGTDDAGFETAFQRLLHWSAETDAAIEGRVAQIIDDVRARGDAAVLELTARFDGVLSAAYASSSAVVGIRPMMSRCTRRHHS